MIIDIHSHCFPDALSERAISTLSEKAAIPAYTDGTVKDLKRSMNYAGIDICILQHIATKPEQTINVNRWAVEIQDESIISFGTIHPDFPDWKEEICWLKSSGIKGVKFHPEYQNFYVDAKQLFPIYEELCSKDFVILFHAGVDLGFQPPFHCTPGRLAKVLDAFQGSKIIAAHMGGYKYWEEVEKYLLGRDVYLDTSFACKDLGPEAMENFIRKHGTGKVLFGSDTPWTEQATELTNIRSLGFSKEEETMILGENAAALLSLN